MGYEIVGLFMTAALGFAAVLIFRPESYWARMAVGAAVGLSMWVIKVTVIWITYRAQV